MIELKISDHSYPLPENWEELISTGTYIPLMRILNNPALNEEQMKFQVLQLITGFKGLELEGVSELLFSFQMLEDVFPTLNYIFEATPFYTNPLTEFTHNQITYKGPDDYLTNQTGEEWSITHHARNAFSKQPGKMLITMAAANYHPVIDGQRSPFDEKVFEATLKAFELVPVEILLGINLWYQHADAWWVNKFQNIFGGSAAAKKTTGMEVQDILFELAGNKLDDAWDKVKGRQRQDIIYALDRLEKRRTETAA